MKYDVINLENKKVDSIELTDAIFVSRCELAIGKTPRRNAQC